MFVCELSVCRKVVHDRFKDKMMFSYAESVVDAYIWCEHLMADETFEEDKTLNRRK